MNNLFTVKLFDIRNTYPNSLRGRFDYNYNELSEIEFFKIIFQFIRNNKNYITEQEIYSLNFRNQSSNNNNYQSIITTEFNFVNRINRFNKFLILGKNIDSVTYGVLKSIEYFRQNILIVNNQKSIFIKGFHIRSFGYTEYKFSELITFEKLKEDIIDGKLKGVILNTNSEEMSKIMEEVEIIGSTINDSFNNFTNVTDGICSYYPWNLKIRLELISKISQNYTNFSKQSYETEEEYQNRIPRIRQFIVNSPKISKELIGKTKKNISFFKYNLNEEHKVFKERKINYSFNLYDKEMIRNLLYDNHLKLINGISDKYNDEFYNSYNNLIYHDILMLKLNNTNSWLFYKKVLSKNTTLNEFEINNSIDKLILNYNNNFNKDLLDYFNHYFKQPMFNKFLKYMDKEFDLIKILF